MNPYAHHRVKSKDSIDCKKMKFIFTEYGKVSTAEGDKAIAVMIAELATHVEQTYGLVATRLCRALHSKNLSRHRFRYLCCIPAFIFVSLQIAITLSLIVLALIYGVPSNQHSINLTYISLSSVLGVSILLSLATWLRLFMGLLKSPRSKIMKFSENSSRLNEGSLYRLKKQVSQLSYIIKAVEAFLNINTRLVVLIDGLDVCEQQRILQILDQIHVLLTKENDPFITLIVCDPHKMMQDLTNTIVAPSASATNQGFDSSVNGQDYLRSIIQLPIYLQLNLSKTKQLKKNIDQFPKKRQNTLNNGSSALDISKTAPAPTTEKLPKSKRRRQRRENASNRKPVTTSELTNQLLQSDYFLDINPRILQRLINIIAMTGRLLRANQVSFSWKRLGCWSYLIEQWPYRMSWIFVYYEDHEDEYSDDTELKVLYDKIKPFIPISNDPLLELDRNARKFELCIEQAEPVLNVKDLKQFLFCTCNLDPYLNKLIRESPAYFYLNGNDTTNGFVHADPSRCFPRYDSTCSNRPNGFAPTSVSRRRRHPHAGGPTDPITPYHRPSFDLLAHRLYQQMPAKKRADDEDSHNRTSSVSSSSVPLDPKDSSGNVKLDLSPPLSKMSVNEICDCLKNEIIGLKANAVPIYVQDIVEYNISGQVLSTCQLDELKQVLSMTFGDWVLFTNWVMSKRENERSARRFQASHTSSSATNPHSTFTDASNEYQLCTEHSVLGAALNRILSANTRNSTSNSLDETRLNTSDGFSIVSAPKNVKFLIPLARSGVTSNESTYGLVESTSRTITHVKDIFPLNSSNMQHSNGTAMHGSSSSQSVRTSEMMKNDESEEAPLINKESSIQN